MRVALVSPYALDAPGGVQDQVLRLRRWLLAAGHEAMVVAPGSSGPEGTALVGGFVNVPGNRSRAPISLNPAVVRRVAAAVAGFDVVHIHEPFMPMVSLGAMVARTPPKVGTFHADPSRLGRLFYRSGVIPLRGLARRLAAVTAVSEVAAAGIGPVARPKIVPNGIDLPADAGSFVKDPLRVLFIGRDEARKGLDVLLSAWPAVTTQVPGARLRVVGAEREPSDGVDYLGRVGREEKDRELEKAAVLAAPNLGGESFGIVVLEGLASGCSVVASDLAAFRAVAGEAARYSPVGDAAALTTALVDVLQRVTRHPNSTSLVAAQPFGRDEVLRGYLEAYTEAMAKG